MRLLLAVLVLATQDPGLVLERTVTLTTLDWLGQKREVRRRERVAVRGTSISVTDLTFGERLVVRPELRRIWKADPLAGTFAEYGFDELAAVRKEMLDELRAAKARVPGTPDEQELGRLLEGLDEYPAPPRVEVRADGPRRELIVNGDRVKASVELDPKLAAGAGWFEALSAAGGFHPAVAEKLRGLGGFPAKGTVRYVLFLDRVIEDFEVTSSRAEAVPDSEFELPRGLRREPLKGFGRPAERRPAKPGVLRKDFKEDEAEKRANPLNDGEKKDQP
jgi:hypothetical protein